MNTQNTVIGIIVLLILVGAGWYFVAGQNEDVMMKDDAMQDDSVVENDSMMKDEGAMMEKDNAMMEGDSMMEKNDATMKDGGTMMEEGAMMKKGSYEPYAAAKLANASNGDVVLFFRASWCPTCRALDADINAHLGSIPEGVTILDVDYDNSTALKQKYGVTYQHTLVQVDAQGNMIKKWSKSANLASLLGEIQ